MNREERKRRFNEAIVNTLYPPQDLEPVVEDSIELGSNSELYKSNFKHNVENIFCNAMSDTLNDYENASTSGEEEEEHDSETEKLTRAQRKRLRKKKMKEEAIVRGKLIGPMMPLAQRDDVPPSVRLNASQEGDETTCAKSKKTKQRRMTKRVAREKKVAPASEKCDQSSISSDAVDEMKEPPS